MKAPSVRPVRCAIYTRVSTEHGLEDGLSCEINIPLNVMQERPLAVVAPQARQ
jgi:hypothetical protein